MGVRWDLIFFHLTFKLIILLSVTLGVSIEKTIDDFSYDELCRPDDSPGGREPTHSGNH